MSYKQYVLRLLEQDVKSTAVVKKTNSLKDKRKKLRNGITKKNRMQILADIKKKPRLHSNKLLNRAPKKNFLKSEFATNYSDSDVEINISSSSETNWINELNINTSPSKSEHAKNILNSVSVDTIYHTKSTTNNAILLLEDSKSEYGAEIDNLLLIESKPQHRNLQETSISIYDSKDGKVIILKNKDAVSIQGSFNLSVLYGNLNIFGHNLNSLSNEVQIYSLRGFSYLFMQNAHTNNEYYPDITIRNKLSKSGVCKADLLNIFSDLKEGYVVFLCSVLKDCKLLYIEKHVPQKLLPIFNINLPIIGKNAADVNVLHYNPQWDRVVDIINQTSKVMVCGGKGVGKTTLLRYLVNKLLMNFESILVIDLDPGQSEFTIPGCVSAVLVTLPIFGPNFTHLQQPKRCIFVENVDVTLEPDVYIKSVRVLLEQCKDMPGVPTLINYMGYTQNYGINIASSVITYVSPTVLLQINSTQQTKNFPEYLTPEVVNYHSDMFGASVKTNLSFQFISINSMCDKQTGQPHNRTVREMCILSYFSKILDSSMTLTSKNVLLYKISLKNVTLVYNGYKPIGDNLPTFNASLVGLCTLTSTVGVYNCHGWGIIRGIDQEKLILITPVDEDLLERTTHLCIGSIVLPSSMLMYEDGNIGIAPYVSLGCRTSFNHIPKRSYLPIKKY